MWFSIASPQEESPATRKGERDGMAVKKTGKIPGRAAYRLDLAVQFLADGGIVSFVGHSYSLVGGGLGY
jgi:hypothetical protein